MGIIPQTVFTLEGFWRLVLGIGEMFAGGRAAGRPLIFAAIYSTWCMSRRSRAGETVGRATFDSKTHMI